MRFEPSNAKFFSVEVNWESVTTVLRLTAAFNEKTELSDENEEEGIVKPLLIKCHQVFTMEEDIHLGLFIPQSQLIKSIDIQKDSRRNAINCILPMLFDTTSIQYGLG